MCSNYYKALVRSDAAERKAGWDAIVLGLERFSAELEAGAGDGPFLCGADLSVADVALLPWALRLHIFEHHRGWTVPDSPALAAYRRWLAAAQSLDCVASTTPEEARYVEHIAKYADGTARSKVANAVRRGAGAHEFDDERD